MKTSTKIFFTGAILLLALPVLFFPLSCDIAIFASGGQVIASGGKIYVDYIDIKPPIVYYFFSLVYMIAGWEEFLIRVVEFFFLAVTLGSLIYTMDKRTGAKHASWAAAAIFAASYSALGYGATFQCETIIALPLIWLMYIHTGGRELWRSVAAGGLAGFITGFKFTLGLVLAAILLDIWLGHDLRIGEKIRHSLIVILFFIISLFITLIPLLDPEIFAGYRDVLDFIFAYTGQGTAASNPAFILKGTAEFLSDKVSLLVIFGALAGLWMALRGGDLTCRRYYYFSFILTAFLLLTVIIEQKLFPYHFARFYIPLSILAGAGIFRIYRLIREKWPEFSLYARFLTLGLVCLAILFSPLPRWGNLMKVPYTYFTDSRSYDNLFERPFNPDIIRSQRRQVADTLRAYMQPGDSLLVMDVVSDAIYFFAKAGHAPKYAVSSFYFGRGASPRWKLGAMEELAKADWLVINHRVGHPAANEHNLTAWESLRQNEIMYDYVMHNFERTHEFRTFYIYTKIGQEVRD
ncbi:MAG: glycosyltransferase family 39 protein [Candidatus Kapaibacterium sp.]